MTKWNDMSKSLKQIIEDMTRNKLKIYIFWDKPYIYDTKYSIRNIKFRNFSFGNKISYCQMLCENR